MNSTTPQQDCCAGFPAGVTFSAAVFAVFALLTYGSYKCRRSLPQSSPAGDPTHDDDNDDDRPRGLDAKVLQSYPMFKYQELKRDDRTGMSCAICLADYNDADPVRLLPNCGHVFHVGCVDAWLVRHASCPNCRSSPEFLTLVQAPPVGPRQMTPHAL